jgi:flavin reductase (DIM6/NTAB) family NADH-FMN oxidoreductase RutF
VSTTLNSPYITDSIVDSAIALVLVRVGDRSNAMTVSFFSEVAHHPTSLWVSIAKNAYTHSLIEECGKFSLAVLNQAQKQIAMTCGLTSGRDVDKCSTLDLYPGPEGYLFLNAALASTACIVRERIAIEDHTVFVADILESQIESRKSHLRQLLLSDLRT